jgi:HAMP domain-containing protein
MPPKKSHPVNLNHMRIETRFAWIIGLCFCVSASVAGYISYTLEFRQAQEDIKRTADMLLETALAVRAYTVDEVAPALRGVQDGSFHAAQVPSFAAQSTMQRLARKFPDYVYRESALNPTNQNDRASDWEVGLRRAFQDDAKLTELAGETGSGLERHFYLARPIRMGSPACLQGHDTAAAAPASMVAKYGAVNGFGWKMGDVIGLQLMQVPTAPARNKAFQSVLATIGSLTCVFVLSAAVFLLLLRRHVTKPLEMLTRAAHAASLNERSGVVVPAVAGSQFGDLQQAINRLRSSVDQALRLFERTPELRRALAPSMDAPATHGDQV